MFCKVLLGAEHFILATYGPMAIHGDLVYAIFAKLNILDAGDGRVGWARYLVALAAQA